MPEFYKLDVQATLKELAVEQESGLSAAEVTKRQTQYGMNSLPVDEGTNWIKLILGQFTDLMVLILLAAAIISFFLGDAKDVIVIMVIVILNAILGVYQEYRAEQALAALSAMQVPLVSVRRGKQVHEISAEELVPGDIVLLEEGDRIPSDGRLIESVNLRVEEAALTGESQPIDKNIDPIHADGNVAVGDRGNMVFMGTSITYGRGEMAVTQIGLKTELGNIAALLLQIEEGSTPLQRRMVQLGKVLGIAAGIIVAIVFFVGWAFQNIPAQEMFLIAISMAVAAVPEGLPALVTIGLSLGASRMVKRHALIRRLPAVETLGSVTIICSDKTGTLTKNEMTATLMALPRHDNVEVTGIGYTPEGDFHLADGTPLNPSDNAALARFLKAMALSTNAHLESLDGNGSGSLHVVGDTTEGALMIAAQKVGWTREQLELDLPRVAELPFSSERKAMTTVHKITGKDVRHLFPASQYISITKGAPDRLVEWATYEHIPEGPQPLTEERRQEWLHQIDVMAGRGLRVLGVAYRPLDAVPEKINPEIERGLYLIGLVGILDPARPEAKEAVAIARKAGIRSVMITGDHALTAEAIARDLGILKEGQEAVTGTRLDKMSDEEISKALDVTSCFARVSPEHKLKLVRILQSRNEIVAMTGDGVNDAPALKQADIGVAMGITGTDVSKGASEMVLTDDNFASIVAAVEEGRAIYDNIRKFIKYLLSSNVGEILVMFCALMLNFRVPLIAIQILWINLVTDGLPAIALGFEPAEKDVMDRKPRPVNESVFAGGTGRHIVWVGILIAILTLGGYVFAHHAYGMDPVSPTLGLENFSRASLSRLIDGDKHAHLLQDWDTMSVEDRITAIKSGDVEDQTFGESSRGIVGEVERIPRTIAFTILAFTQMFEVMAIHAGDKESFFKSWFRHNPLLFLAVLSTFVLQVLVIYVPFFQQTFETAALTGTEMLLTFVLAGVILVAVEFEKLLMRRNARKKVAQAA